MRFLQISFTNLMILTSMGFCFGQQYISPLGNDTTGSGTKAKPWKTLSYACSKATKGTIYLSEGTFIEDKPSFVPAGVSLTGSGVSKTIIKSNFFHAVTFMDIAPDYYLTQVSQIKVKEKEVKK